MPSGDLNRLSASEIADAIAEGSTTSEAVVMACLERVAEREDMLRAWAFLDPDLALDQARERDRVRPIGPLHGVPIGVKDIIDTVDMPTEMGSPIYAGNLPRDDAACVALARTAGAVILGKTVTAEFAGMGPGATANPHNPAHTPGGSSSGSAAAVADYMVPLAFGTQTGGSVLRPSSYCGIIGFKPTFGLFNLGGVRPAAQSLDTLGLHGRTIEDIDRMTAVLVGREPGLRIAGDAPTIGLCRTPMWPDAEPETVEAVEDAAGRLAAAGARVREVVLPAAFDKLHTVREMIAAYERSQLMTHEWTHHRDHLSALLQAEIERGFAVSFDDYVAAMRHADHCRGLARAVIAEVDIILAPSADGAAPEGLASTGSARFQGFWTILRVPSITLPTHAASNGMPVGIQLVGRMYEDEVLLANAQWALERLGTSIE